MTRITDRERLIRTTRGENLDNSLRYKIEYSLDIRGNLTIWGGMSFYRFEAVPMIDDSKRRVSRELRPIYDYHRLSPYTARIFRSNRNSTTISPTTDSSRSSSDSDRIILRTGSGSGSNS